eukprot:Nk52_evm20s304 gene=Nk52_evmTU20s304
MPGRSKSSNGFRLHCYLLILLIVLCGLCERCQGDEHDHHYTEGEPVILWMNTIWPAVNQQEQYEYYSLPFCRGSVEDIGHHHETIGEALLGVELQFSGLDIKFKRDKEAAEYCSTTLTTADLEELKYAVIHNYKYQMYIDDLPIWGRVSEWTSDVETSADKDIQYYVFSKMNFKLYYNGDQIVKVRMSPSSKVILAPGISIDWRYSVEWKESNIEFGKRFEPYYDKQFFQNQVHWFSIFNSFMMVLFLVGLVSMILMRTLRQDFARYSRDEEDLDDLERDLGDEYGWKQVIGDVFRPPPHLTAFSALIGIGAQLFFASLVVILLSILGNLYESRGSILSTFIFVYAATSPIAGFFGSSYYLRGNGKSWIRQMLVTAGLLPTLICSVAFLVNFMAIYYESSRAIPFGTMIAVFCICIFVILPLTLVGTILGRNMFGQANNPCRVNPVPRPIPEKKWYMEPLSIVILGGILPFASIFIETHFILTSFWKFRLYYVFGFMLLVFFMLSIVTVCVTIVCVYFLLNSEDYRWHWVSLLSAASTAVYVYIYSIYFFVFTSKMYGWFQTVFYFSYMGLMCFILGTLCGAVGFFGANLFVRKIYTNVKID